MKRFIITLIILLLITIDLGAQNSNQVQTIGIDQGLSNNNVTKIYKDKEGFMWFGSYDGLNRYDAYTFKIYRNDPSDINSLPDNRITDIIEDGKRNLWVGTRAGLAVLDRNSGLWKRLHLSKQTKVARRNRYEVNKLLYQNNTIYAATDQEGILKIVNHDGNWHLEKIQLKLDSSILNNYTVRSMCMDLNNNLWAVVRDIGLCLLDNKANRLKKITSDIKDANDMTISQRNEIWVVNNLSLKSYNRENKQVKEYLQKDVVSNTKMVNILSVDNHMWVGTDGSGIMIVDSETGNVSYLDDGTGKDILSSKSVFSSYKDNQGRIWVGTLRGGINLLDPLKGKFKSFQNDEKPDVYARNYVMSLAENSAGLIWIGTDGAGLYQLNRKDNVYRRYGATSLRNTLSSDYITHIICDKHDDLWIGTYHGGINKYSAKTRKFERFNLENPNSGKTQNFVWKLFIDSQDKIWASTLDGGSLYIYDKKLNVFKALNQPIHDVISFYQENSSTIWFGSWDVVIRYDVNTHAMQKYAMRHPVRFIQKDHNSHLWIGTEGGGLIKLDLRTQKTKSFTEKDGLPSNTILNLLEDRYGYYWISTYNGLSRFDPRKEKFENFQKSDGLQSNQFSYNAAVGVKSGELLFGGIRGFNLFNPKDFIEHSSTAPTIAFTEVLVQNDSYFPYQIKKGIPSDTLNLVIPYDKSVLSVGFSALEYSFSDKIKYAYKLDGWDKNWHYVNDQRRIQYSNLREGTFILKIKSTNASGQWSLKEKVMLIHILPPWYRTYWAYIGYLCLLSCLFCGYIYYVKKQTSLKYQVKIKEVEIRNERESHEKKLQFVSHIANEFRTPLTLILNPAKEMLKNRKDADEETAPLRHMYNNSKRLLTLVDKLMLFQKSEHDLSALNIKEIDINNLCKEVYHYFEQHATLRQINYIYKGIIEDDLTVKGDREKLEICLFNIIGNALKYTNKGGTVDVTLATNEESIFINVGDTGPGIKNEVGENIFQMYEQYRSDGEKVRDGLGIGLFFARKFARLHNGDLFYTNKLLNGTFFTLQLPLKNNSQTFNLPKKNSQLQSNLFPKPVVDLCEDWDDEDQAIDSLEKTKLNFRERDKLFIDKLTLLVVDDNSQIRKYIKSVFHRDYNIVEGSTKEEAVELLRNREISLVISDILLRKSSGIDLCLFIKQSDMYSHIPVILISGNISDDAELRGWESGADDYFTKPFSTDILAARVKNLIAGKNRLQQYFYNEITLQTNHYKISEDYSAFLKKAIEIVEKNLTNPNLGVKLLVDEIGMSHSYVYKKIKVISGKSANEFIRYIRLRKVAQLLLDTDLKISEAAYKTGFNDIKHFRLQFLKLFGEKPSDYRKKYQSFKRTTNIALKEE
ncbi:hybrid sensor histidine kinase/response regulator transcription factor [Sphingobacterium bambusae]|uniref:histidine kinase n=1 Tax=Sphingobacterium bambusae TaxID=662858 RepID=A0ABW6BJ42_9SPHI|nr:two-component regulator propeller domain-containing protein [Sphingobacterium bambusae]WPL49486.1 two-component regulator propeller domain-containing protein [Sphingobacterium bambusae]